MKGGRESKRERRRDGKWKCKREDEREGGMIQQRIYRSRISQIMKVDS